MSTASSQQAVVASSGQDTKAFLAQLMQQQTHINSIINHTMGMCQATGVHIPQQYPPHPPNPHQSLHPNKGKGESKGKGGKGGDQKLAKRIQCHIRTPLWPFHGFACIAVVSTITKDGGAGTVGAVPHVQRRSFRM